MKAVGLMIKNPPRQGELHERVDDPRERSRWGGGSARQKQPHRAPLEERKPGHLNALRPIRWEGEGRLGGGGRLQERHRLVYVCRVVSPTTRGKVKRKTRANTLLLRRVDVYKEGREMPA